MGRRTFQFIAVATAVLAGPVTAIAESASNGCAFVADPDASLDRVSDCMRMGRHVRVETSVSRGTATLGDGPTSAALRSPEQQRIRAADPAAAFFSGIFAR